MFNNLAIIFSFVLFTIIPAYAASPEQPSSVPAPPKSETIINVKSLTDTDQNETPLHQNLQTLINDANKGYPSAQFKLGEMYSKGSGVPQDYNKAFKLQTGAAEQGNATAQRNLALMYYDGKGVIEDYVEAYKWALLAGMNGEDVTKIKQDLTAKMTPDQIAEAQKLAKDFVAKKENAKNNSTTKPNLLPDENKDELRVERLSKKNQEMNDVIELDKKRIKNLPSICCSENCPPHGPHRSQELTENLDTATKKWTLLAEQERNYKQIVHLAEKNHDLGIDVMDMKKKLIECQGREEELKSVEDCLREKMQRDIDRQRENNNRNTNHRSG